MVTVGQSVTVSDKQLHGNISTLVDGTVVSMNGSSVKVHVRGEELPRDFPVDKVKSSESTYGQERMSPFDSQVINALRRY